jgi:hypothetical protein
MAAGIDVRSLPTRLLTLARPTARLSRPPVNARPTASVPRLRGPMATLGKPVAALDGPVVFLKALHGAVAAPMAHAPVRSVPI